MSGLRAGCLRVREGGGRAVARPRRRRNLLRPRLRGAAPSVPVRPGGRARRRRRRRRRGGRHDAALPAHRGAVLGLRFLLSPLCLQPARRVPRRRRERRWREVAGPSGFLAPGRRTRRRERGGQHGSRSASRRVGQVRAVSCVAETEAGAGGLAGAVPGARPGPGFSPVCPAPPAAGPAPPASLPLSQTPFHSLPSLASTPEVSLALLQPGSTSRFCVCLLTHSLSSLKQ